MFQVHKNVSPFLEGKANHIMKLLNSLGISSYKVEAEWKKDSSCHAGGLLAELLCVSYVLVLFCP